MTVLSSLNAQTDPARAVELEKAIFLQETKKDFTAAASLYAELVEKSKQTNLEALYRLSQCQKSLGKKEESVKTLRQLVADKNKDNQWVKLAISEQPKGLGLQPPIWEDGDYLGYDLFLPNGKMLRYYTLIYDQDTQGAKWKVTTLRSSFDDSRSEIVFDSESCRPLDYYWVFLNGGGGYHTKSDPKAKWDHFTFENDLITSLARVLPQDTLKRSFVIDSCGQRTKATLRKTDEMKMIKTKVGEYECQKVICIVQTMEVEMWLNTKGKRELIELSQPGLRIQLAEIGTREKYQKKVSKFSFFNGLYESKTCLHEEIMNNKEVFRAMLFPSNAIFLARLEINHTKNLLKSLRKDPVALANHLETNIRKTLGVDAVFKMPETAEKITLASCKGILYAVTTRKRDGYGDDHYVCFYGTNDKQAIFLRGLYKKGQEKEAIAELKRILSEDLKVN